MPSAGRPIRAASRVSALERLRDLPEVFSLRTAATALDLEIETMTVYAFRWRQKGLVENFGRTGVYFNLLKNPDAANTMVAEALYMALGNLPLVEVGGSALVDSGLTMQRHIRLEVAVICDRRPTLPTLPGISLLRRPIWWGGYLAQKARIRATRSTVLPCASASLAMADAILSHHVRQAGIQARPDPDLAWLPTPDEVATHSFAREDLSRTTHQHLAGLIASAPEDIFQGSTSPEDCAAAILRTTFAPLAQDLSPAAEMSF
ncbi:hypothetical protein FE249_18715 (plasmid) [Acidiphilium multivorum]|uniref:hypothetical protein n=1 Tax=Acidiphilium multivorum TaxID=62140 RepID=UPI001F4C040E|nr:hypothetical protein [Acidiphilium multivorum]UNC16250.1 hypothetical protein FE249_18715 [Acidiphilium multivorum]